MPKCAHKFAPLGQRHALHNWEVADEAGLADIVPTKCDVYKLALALDTNTFYVLTLLEPPTWAPINSGPEVFRVVETIAERDLIVEEEPVLCLVKDATADSTVDAGAALYVWEPSGETGAWSKIAEYESLDVTWVATWATVEW